MRRGTAPTGARILSPPRPGNPGWGAEHTGWILSASFRPCRLTCTHSFFRICLGLYLGPILVEEGELQVKRMEVESGREGLEEKDGVESKRGDKETGERGMCVKKREKAQLGEGVDRAVWRKDREKRLF